MRLGAWMLLLVFPSVAAAQTCRCPTFDLTALVARAEVIFIGKSLTATRDSEGAIEDGPAGGWLPGEEYQTRVAFDVTTLLKGKVPRFTEVVTPTTACGFPFAVGTTYLITGHLVNGRVATDSCQGNANSHIASRAAAIRQALRGK